MIYLGVPSARDWKPQFGVALCMAITDLVSHGYKIVLHGQLQTSLLPNGREKIVESAIKNKASHLVFLDDDMSFPPEAIRTLIEHDKDVVGVDYRKKNKDDQRTALTLEGGRFKEETGLQECLSMGLGLTVIKTSILEKTEPGRFEIRWRGNCYQGEDSSFFQKLHDVGAEIYCDLDLSRKMAHIGDGAFVIGG